MSGFSYPQPTFVSSCYNPAFYLSLDQTGYLTYAYAQTLYLGINDYRLSYITGITPGTATPGISLVVTSDGSLSGLGALSCSSLTVNGSAVSSPPSYVLDITPGTAALSKALVLDSSSNISGINSLSATNFTGTLQTAAQPNVNSVNVLNIANHNGSTTGLSLGGVLITASASEINYIDVVAGTAAASKALVLNASSNISGINSLSASSLTGTLQTAAQPNITSLGTLTGLSCSGSISGTLSTAAQPNITSLGTITAVNCSGNVSGTLTTAAQGNITSVGTLTGLTVSGNISITGTSASLSLSGGSSFISLSNISASTSSTTGAFRCLGGGYFGAKSVINANLGLIASSGVLSIANTSSSINSTSGAIQCLGGAYFGANSVIGASLTLSSSLGSLIITNPSGSTSSSTGAIQCAGGAYFGGASLFNSSVSAVSVTTTGDVTANGHLAGFLSYGNQSAITDVGCCRICQFFGSNATPVGFQIEVNNGNKATSTNAAWIGTSTANDLKLGTGGTTQAILTSAGRFGIGTTSPSAWLEVSGSVSQTVDAAGLGYGALTKSNTVFTIAISPQATGA
ncbi:hypothetical protein ON010_g4776 [Phytophthora cinnamomi]|nr:hypothetical protein ON010_g4776 [Phytophthora cinnamomi]